MYTCMWSTTGQVETSIDAPTEHQSTDRRSLRGSFPAMVYWPAALSSLLAIFTPLKSIHIFRDAAVERVGDALAVFAGFEPVLVAGI